MQVKIPSTKTIEVELPFFGKFTNDSVCKVISESEFVYIENGNETKIEHTIQGQMGAWMLGKIMDKPISENEFNEGAKKAIEKLNNLFPELKEVDIPTLRDLGNSIVDNNNLQ
jgi:hypothetical protein